MYKKVRVENVRDLILLLASAQGFLQPVNQREDALAVCRIDLQ